MMPVWMMFRFDAMLLQAFAETVAERNRLMDGGMLMSVAIDRAVSHLQREEEDPLVATGLLAAGAIRLIMQHGSTRHGLHAALDYVVDDVLRAVQ